MTFDEILDNIEACKNRSDDPTSLGRAEFHLASALDDLHKLGFDISPAIKAYETSTKMFADISA